MVWQEIEASLAHRLAKQVRMTCRMNRCHLKGSDGDAIHAVLRGVGHNIRWLLRMILKKGIRHYLSLIRLLVLRRLFTRKATATPEYRFAATQIHLLVTS